MTIKICINECKLLPVIVCRCSQNEFYNLLYTGGVLPMEVSLKFFFVFPNVPLFKLITKQTSRKK